MNYRRSILSAAIVTCLGVAVQAHAQDAQPTGTQATDLDTVVVTGIRGSIEKALDAKRDAATHVEVVTAEDIGKLPAKNVADTLRQLPGVNIASSSASEGGFDEADRVSLRGTNPSLTQTLAKVPDAAILFPGHQYSAEPSASMADTRRWNFVFAPKTQREWLAMFGA